jgi:hypothetical protein
MSTERAVSGSSMWPGPLPPMPPFARRTAGEDWYSGRRVPVLLWPGHLPACPADTAHRNERNGVRENSGRCQEEQHAGVWSRPTAVDRACRVEGAGKG